MEDITQVLRRIHLECRLILGKLGDSRPSALSWSSHNAKDPHDLVLIRGSRKQGPSSVHLSHYTACRPYVDACIVSSTPKKNIWSTIPQCDDLIGKRVDRDSKSAGKTKVTKFQQSLAVDEKVLRLEVTMKNSILVTKVYPLEQLIHEAFDRSWLESATFAVCVHVSFQVAIHIFENKHELVFGVDNIM